ALVKGVLEGSRGVLARAITLVESHRPDHRQAAQQMLMELLPHAGGARRVGISGVPGVGKSTFIEALGTRLTAAGHRVAVLAVDPSSTRTKGSILGDKTRMARLASDDNAFVRPSPSAGTLGGVARATRETIVLMEAAGYDVVLVETVGVNKADGPHEADARAAARELRGALRMLTPASAAWTTPVLTCSAQTGAGMEEVWQAVLDHRAALEAAGELERRRADQQVEWMWRVVRDTLLDRLQSDEGVRAALPGIERAVREGELTPTLAAQRLLEHLHL